MLYTFFRVNGFENIMELIIRYLAKNVIDFKPFITTTNMHFARFRFLVDSNDLIIKLFEIV